MVVFPLFMITTFLCICGKTGALPTSTSETKPTKLFPVDHPNVTYISDSNFNSTVIDSGVPFVVDFYHPYCPLCQSIVGEWQQVAAYYSQQGGVRIGAVSCMEESICRKMKIVGFPSMVAFNFNPAFRGENERIIGLHTLHDIQAFVERLKRSGGVANTETKIGMNTPSDTLEMKYVGATIGTTSSGTPGLTGSVITTSIPPVPFQNVSVNPYSLPPATPLDNSPNSKGPVPVAAAPTLYENTTTPSTQTTRIQDAASALIYALHSTVFSGEILEDVELDALKEWLRVISETFPGWFNRQLLSKLWSTIQYIPYLDYDTWVRILVDWQGLTVTMYNQQTKEYLATAPQWQQIPDLFSGNGTTYRFCHSYTCGQWTLFHMLTVNPQEKMQTDKNLPVAVISAIRRFMKFFFGCAECRGHFMQENPLDVVTVIYKDPNPSSKLRIWLWEMHNKVNIRLHHPVWPKREVCPDCISEVGWNIPKVEQWLTEFYSYN